MAKLNFQHHYSSHDPSEIILICGSGAQETFLIIKVKNCCAAKYACRNHDTILFSIENSKEQNFFCNTIVFFVVF